ncbi:MAG: O-antigen ligase family protein [Gammaproteobacteria bacterium]
MRTLLSKAAQNPPQQIMGLCVFMVVASGAALQNVASTSLAVMFILSLFYVRDWVAAWKSLEMAEKMVFIGFALYTLTALLSWVNANDTDEFIKQFGRYLRFTLIIPVYLVMRHKNMDVSRYLLAGVVLSGFIYLGIALNNLYLNPGQPAAGHYHHITFGDGAMLSVGVMSVMLLMPQWKLVYRFVIGISMLCALYAAFMSQARGAWIVLPVYLLLFIVYNAASHKSAMLKLAVAGAALGALVMLTPAGNTIEKRYNEAVTEVSQFFSGERVNTSIGNRLSMWAIAYEVWVEHPIIGSGLGDFEEDMVYYQGMGKYPEADVYGSTHNIFVQALAGTGVIGLVALGYALVIAPLMLFLGYEGSQKPYAEMGVLIIASYIVFGLSESWILRAPTISIYLAYVIALINSLHNK